MSTTLGDERGPRRSLADGADAPIGCGAEHGHLVQFYETDAFLAEVVADYLAEGLRAGERTLVVATEPHRRAFCDGLAARAFDVERARAEGRLVLLDARETLAELMVDGAPSGERLRASAERVMAQGTGGARGVRIYGEMVDLLWRDGLHAAAVHLEELWSDLRRDAKFSLLCAYTMDGFCKEGGWPETCAAHGRILPPEGVAQTDGVDAQPLTDPHARALAAEVAHRHEVENALRESLRSLRQAEGEARRSRDELTDFLDNAVLPLHCVGASGEIEWANRAALALLGYRAEEYVGRPLAALHVDPLVAEDLLARLRRGETLRDYEAQLYARDGSIVHVLVDSSARAQDGAFVRARCFLRDVTEHRRAAAERDRVVEELERTVRLNELLAGVLAHDLRNPLNAILTAAQLVLRRADDERAMRPLHRILSSGERMARMIEQLLDFTRARSGGGIPLDRRGVDLRRLAEEAVEEVELASSEWRARVEAAGSLEGEWDAGRLAQVFSNLVGNAAQHGSRAAPLVVRLDGTRAEAVRIEVHNDGVIPASLLPRLFDPFRTAQHKRDGARGLGLGLFITEQIVRAHGGEISVASTEDDGTTFRIELPRRGPGDARAVTLVDPLARGREGDAEVVVRVREMAALAEEAERRSLVSEERFQLLVESVRDYAILMLDPQGYVQSWNRGVERIKGYSASEIMGKHFSAFYPPEDVRAGVCDRALELAEAEGRFESEGWRIRKDGSRYWANAILTALRDASGRHVGFVKVTRDLTERRRFEEESLRRANAEGAIRLRDEFLSIASHELKTPLTVLQLQLERLHKQVEPLDERVAHNVDRALRAGARLSGLVDALLDVSRMASGRFELRLERFDLADASRNVLARVRDAAARAGCALSSRIDPAVPGTWDRLRVEQLLTHLLANAIRYGAGAPIDVSLARDGDSAVLEVRDRGPGLSEADLARIFGRFERAASPRHYGGMGLGLYIARQVADAHGGAISARNAPEGGACFTVRLPLAAPAGAPGAPQ